MVFEHITTRDAVHFVTGAAGDRAPPSRRSTCCMNRNALFAGGLRPHHYCLPVLKAEADRAALLAAVAAAVRAFSSAPTAPRTHAAPRRAACGCAGIFSAHAGIELYAEAFAAAGALDTLEAFASIPRRRTSTACRATSDTLTLLPRALGRAGALPVRLPTSWYRCAPASASAGASIAKRVV